MTPAVVLAAGSSSRYAAGNKLLADIGGVPLLVRILTQIRPVACPIVVVTGHQAWRVRRLVRQWLGHAPDLRFVHNHRYREGMASSLKLGVASLPPGASKAFLCLGDMPGVDTRLLRRLRMAWQPDLDVVRPACRGRPGHPVLVSARLFPAFETLSGDYGAKSILATVPTVRQKRVAWHAGCIIDTDTPAALRRAALWLKRNTATVGGVGATMRSTPWK